MTEKKENNQEMEAGLNPEAKSGTDQFPRVEKGSKALKISLWIGIPAVALVIILWVLHEWLGLWIYQVYNKWGFADKPCEWMMEHSPLWLLMDGIIKYQHISLLDYKLKPRLKEALPYIFKGMQSKNKLDRVYSVYLLRRLGPAPAEAIEPLKKALNDAFPFVQVHAAIALYKIDPHIEEIAPCIISLIKHEDPYMADFAASAFYDDIDLYNKKYLPALLEGLKKHPSYIYMNIFQQIKDPEEKTLKIIGEYLKHADADLRMATADALQAIGDPLVLPELKEALKAERHFSVKTAIKEAIKTLEKVKNSVTRDEALAFLEDTTHIANSKNKSMEDFMGLLCDDAVIRQYDDDYMLLKDKYAEKKYIVLTKEKYAKSCAGNPAKYKHKVESMVIDKQGMAAVLLKCTQKNEGDIYSYNKKLILEKSDGKIKIKLRERWPISMKYSEVFGEK